MMGIIYRFDGDELARFRVTANLEGFGLISHDC